LRQSRDCGNQDIASRSALAMTLVKDSAANDINAKSRNCGN
jgi:hypothetical protein